MAEYASQMEKKAAEAERAFIKYKQAEFLQDQVGVEYKGSKESRLRKKTD